MEGIVGLEDGASQPAVVVAHHFRNLADDVLGVGCSVVGGDPAFGIDGHPAVERHDEVKLHAVVNEGIIHIIIPSGYYPEQIPGFPESFDGFPVPLGYTAPAQGSVVIGC